MAETVETRRVKLTAAAHAAGIARAKAAKKFAG